MAQDSKIEWTEHTWNPVSGCTKISSGCKNCYAETIANRFWKDRKFTDVQTHSHKLMEPVKRKKPTTYFVNSMSDLFHEDVPFEFIDQVFAVMASTPQHTYQVLTKRPERMLEYFQRLLNGTSDPDPDIWDEARKPIWSATKGRTREYIGVMGAYVKFPLKNVWLGVSVENQEQADKRIPVLLQVPAKIRFLSCEPLLESLDIAKYMWPTCWHWDAQYNTPQEALEAKAYAEKKPQGLVLSGNKYLNWVIIGGESGSGVRPCHIDWIRSLVKQCKDANVACFVKQLGSHSTCGHSGSLNQVKISQLLGSNAKCLTCGFTCPKDPKGGDITEWPSNLQVREFPKP